MKKPKKLIRIKMAMLIPDQEKEIITDPDELNTLYALKIQEELNEIQSSNHKDINEFVDLIQVAWSFALSAGFTEKELVRAGFDKKEARGEFNNIALNNLNPNNPSNSLYFNNSPDE